MIINTNDAIINIIHAKLYTGVKQAKPKSRIKKKILKPIPKSNGVIIATLSFISIFSMPNVRIPHINIIKILNPSKLDKNINNPL
ncbi:MAG: hypothetical protein ACFE8C_09785 [Promethearchaeota archaeon]